MQQNADPDWPDVEALQAGDDNALNRLMDRHQIPVQNFIRRMIGHSGDAEEIAQEVFVRAYFQIHTYRPRARFVAWLYQIARNLCLDYFRSRTFRQSRLSDSLDGMPRELFEPERDHSTDRTEVVQAALLKVPVKFRESLILTAIEGHSHAEAAVRLGLSTKAIEVRSYRARKMLAKILGKL